MHFLTLNEFSGVDERVLLTDDQVYNPQAADTGEKTAFQKLFRTSTPKDVILVPQPSRDVNDPLRWPKWKKHAAFFNVVLMSFMLVGAISGLAPALYKLGPELGANQTQLIGLITFVTLIVGLSQFLWVPLAMLYGRRPIFLLSSIIAFGGLVGCAVAPTYKILLACRLIVGLGGGTTEGLAAALINDIYFLHERGTVMGIYTLSIYAGTGIMSLIGGYMDQTVGWRWFCWLCAIISGVNVLGFFFFFPETRFERSYATPGLTSDSETIDIDKDVEEKQHVVQHVETHSQIEVTGVKKTYLQELDPVPRIDKSVDIIGLFVRPYALFVYPAVFWATVAFSLVIAWVIAASTMTSFVFQAPPYNFSPGTQSLVNIPAVLGNIVGSYSGGYLTDVWVQHVARKQKGIFRAETRLVLLVIPAVAVPAGLLMFGLGAQFGAHWAVLFVGYFLLNTTNGAAAIVMNYVVETFPTIAFECLLTINALKNVICFGFTYGFLPWVTSIGYGAVFGTMAALYLVVLLCAIPFYVWGERIKGFSASRMRLICK